MAITIQALQKITEASAFKFSHADGLITITDPCNGNRLVTQGTNTKDCYKEFLVYRLTGNPQQQHTTVEILTNQQGEAQLALEL